MSLSSTHRRSWLDESGVGPEPLRRGIAAGPLSRRRLESPGRRAFPTRASILDASPAIVGAAKSSRIGSATPNTSRIREINCIARREWPPRSKKSSSIPTRSTRMTSDQMPARSRSSGVRGSTWSSADSARSRARGAGSAAWSTFPLAVRGSASRRTKA